MTDEKPQRFPWSRWPSSMEPSGQLGRHSSQEQQFRRELLSLLPRLRGHALALTGAPDRADDLLQETCERALLRWRQWNGSGPLAAWLLRTMHNRWYDSLRASKVRSADPLPEQGPAIAVPSRAEERTELEQTLAAMSNLRPEQRAALLLVSVEGLSYREAAQVMDVPVGTVRSRVSRARAALMEMLGDGLEQEI